MIKFLELREKLNNGFIPAFALVEGDGWVIERAKEYIYKAYDIVDDGFSVVVLDNPSIKDISIACLTPSMFGGVKAVVCENFVLPCNNEDKETFSKLIANYDKTYCILIDNAKSEISGYDKLVNVDCSRLDTNSVIAWITSMCKRSNIEVTRQCASKLALFCLNDMSRVANETQKLIDYGVFTEESVETMVHKDVEFAIFDLGNVIADKNGAKAIEMYNGLLRQGNDSRSLFGVLYNFYRRVYYVKISTLDAGAIADKLGVKQGAIGFAKEVANKYKPIQLKNALDCFDKADEQLKQFVNDDDVMFLLIMQLLAL